MKHMSTDTHAAILAVTHLLEGSVKPDDVAILLRCIAETGRLSSYVETLENEALLNAKMVDALKADIRGMMVGSAEELMLRRAAIADGSIRLRGGGSLVIRDGRPDRIIAEVVGNFDERLSVLLREASVIWGEDLKIGDRDLATGHALIVDNTLE